MSENIEINICIFFLVRVPTEMLRGEKLPRPHWFGRECVIIGVEMITKMKKKLPKPGKSADKIENENCLPKDSVVSGITGMLRVVVGMLSNSSQNMEI